MTRLDKHDKIHHELFDENTAAVGSLGDVVTAHAGDAVFLTADAASPGGADGGEADFVAEMLSNDPADEIGINSRDLYADDDQIWATDQTGTVEGIARGFGTHLPQDLGRDGFHVEEISKSALKYQHRVVREGEELDDYDDEDETDGKNDPGIRLARLSQPGVNDVLDPDSNLLPGQIHVNVRRPRDADDLLDATREIK